MAFLSVKASFLPDSGILDASAACFFFGGKRRYPVSDAGTARCGKRRAHFLHSPCVLYDPSVLYLYNSVSHVGYLLVMRYDDDRLLVFFI